MYKYVEKFKNRLSEIIKDNHYNYSSFADEVGSSANSISQYANGHKQLPLNIALKICELCECSLDYLYNIERNDMMIDFRELLKCKDNKIHIYIPRKYVEYIIESEKYRDLSELRKILENHNNNIICKISIKKEIEYSFIAGSVYFSFKNLILNDRFE